MSLKRSFNFASAEWLAVDVDVAVDKCPRADRGEKRARDDTMDIDMSAPAPKCAREMRGTKRHADADDDDAMEVDHESKRARTIDAATFAIMGERPLLFDDVAVNELSERVAVYTRYVCANHYLREMHLINRGPEDRGFFPCMSQCAYSH